MAQVTYYFDTDGGPIGGKKASESWANPENMVDGLLNTYGSTSGSGDTQLLDGTDAPGTDLGQIIKCELRVYGYGDGDDRIDVFFKAWERLFTMPSSPGWSAYENTGLPTWADIPTLTAQVQFVPVSKANTMRCARVEIRITYWVGPEADIDVGAIPIDRGSITIAGRTYVDLNNPANASGIIHSIKVWSNSNLTNLVVGTFYLVSGSTYKCRDSVYIGAVEEDAERTFTELSITVVEGDYIGFYTPSDGGAIEKDTSGYAGIWGVAGEHIDPGDEVEYTLLYDGDAISLYGYGDIVAPPEAAVNESANMASKMIAGKLI